MPFILIIFLVLGMLFFPRLTCFIVLVCLAGLINIILAALVLVALLFLLACISRG